MKKDLNFEKSDYSVLWWIETIGCVFFLIGMIYFERIHLVTQFYFPSGADPGNWLTAAWQIGGEKIRLVDWTYPPLLFVILRILLIFFNPIVSLKIMGMAAWALIGVAFILIVRITNPKQEFYFQLGVAVFVVLAGYQGEMYAWGGYPQLLGAAFLIPIIPALEQWFRENKKQWLIVAIICTEGVLYTHHFLTAVMAVFFFLMFLSTILHNLSGYVTVIRKWFIFLIPAAILAIPSIKIYWNFFQYLGIVPTNPQQFGFQSLNLLFDYVFENQTWIWLPVIVLSWIFALIYSNNKLSNTTIIFIGGSLVLLFVSWEVRLSQLLIIGAGYGLLLISDKLKQVHYSKWLRPLFGVALTFLLLISFPAAQNWFVKSTSYYQVVDGDTYSALEWLHRNSEPGDIIAAAPWKPDHIGWSIEGYAQRPCIYASDLKWLVFKGERVNAAIANHLFSKDITFSDLTGIITAQRIKYLFLDKTNNQAFIARFEHNGYFIPVFENNRVLILKINGNLGYQPDRTMFVSQIGQRRNREA